MRRIKYIHGLSLIDVIVGVAIMTLVFMALFASFQAASEFGARNRLRANALLLANEHLEIIRALPFDSIGTVGDLPSGTIPQLEDIVVDGHTYTRRTFIQYVDDPADGIGAADSLAADYKRVKVELSYEYHGVVQTFSLVTTIAPKAQESLAGAGILRINVTDAMNDPIPSAWVHVLNNTVATSVDITTYTNASGTVSLPGAWAGPGYEIEVTKPGYSSAQTYSATTSNPNPSPSPATVAENSTTEIYFKIDRTSTLTVATQAWPVYGRLFDTFADASQLASLENTQVLGGSVTLAGAPGTYSAAGTSTSVSISPTSLGSWLLLSFDDNVPANTNVYYQLQFDTGGGVFSLVPDSDLPGNETGFVSGPVDISGLGTSTYTSLRLQAILTTNDPTAAPEIYEWKLSYQAAPVPVGNVDFVLQGSKTIGTDAGGGPLYKYDQTHQTSATGIWQGSSMEWDQYNLQVTSHTVGEACPALPLVLDPDTVYEQTLTVSPTTTHALRLYVGNPIGNSVEHAEVHVAGGSTDETRASGPCGYVYVPGLASDTYTVSVEAVGFAATSTSISVSGITDASIVLSY